jgi:hypothetical protein
LKKNAQRVSPLFVSCLLVAKNVMPRVASAMMAFCLDLTLEEELLDKVQHVKGNLEKSQRLATAVHEEAHTTSEIESMT